MDFLKGYRTYIAAVGLVATGLVAIIDGNFVVGIQSLLAGLAVFGIRRAVA